MPEIHHWRVFLTQFHFSLCQLLRLKAQLTFCAHIWLSHLSLQITKLTQKKATVAVPGRRLKKLDEANGQIAHNETHFDEQTDNGLMTERTGQVHHGTKQDIVRQWLEGAEQAPPTGAFAHADHLHTISTFAHADYLHTISTWDIYMQYPHAIPTCDIYVQYLHGIPTWDIYMRYLHAMATYDSYIHNYIRYLHTISTYDIYIRYLLVHQDLLRRLVAVWL